MGAVSRNLLGRFDTGPNDVVLVDAEAGVEQFGRKVTATCDLLLDVIDPTFESVQLAARMQQMARKAGQSIIFVLNKYREQLDEAIDRARIDSKAVVARIPEDPRLFEDGLYGRPLARAYTRPKRKEVYDWIKTKTLDLLEECCYDADMAWRLAVETWLLENGFITVSGNPNVLPHFDENRSHH